MGHVLFRTFVNFITVTVNSRTEVDVAISITWASTRKKNWGIFFS
jgi:hypothetical protein